MQFDNSLEIISPDLTSILTIGGKALELPYGDTASRPVTADLTSGAIRYNTTLGQLEVRGVSTWESLPTSATGNIAGSAGSITGVYGGTLTTNQVTSALGFTPYSNTNPSGFTNNTGTLTTISVSSANGFAGTVATATTTPVITLSTTISGLIKGNGTAISAAIAGTDYSLGTSALPTGILKTTTGTGGLSTAVAGDFPILNQSTTGNAATATRLATPRLINGVSFDGTTDITISTAAAAGTLTGTTLATNVVTSSLTSVGTLSALNVTGYIRGNSHLMLGDSINHPNVANVWVQGVQAGISADRPINFIDTSAVMKIARVGGNPGFELQEWDENITTNIGYWDMVSVGGQYQLRDRATTGTTLVMLTVDKTTGSVVIPATLSTSSVRTSVATKTANYTLIATDSIILVNGSHTMTLPAAAIGAGTQYTIKQIGSQPVTIVTNGDTIDGNTAVQLTAQYTSVTIVSDGTNWWII